jgi:hypothetical protein
MNPLTLTTHSHFRVSQGLGKKAHGQISLQSGDAGKRQTWASIGLKGRDASLQPWQNHPRGGPSTIWKKIRCCPSTSVQSTSCQSPGEWERKLGLEDLPRGASQVRPLKRTRASQTVQGRATETRTLRSGHDALSRCLGRARCSFRPRGTSIRKCHGDLTHGGMQWKLGAWGLEAWNHQ